mmetsp:Transcript_14825/g.34797  ORF Transcript_14825/g.34797 Transcript_14825/m.34797 type:complete len:214 (-) Transcript_14825:138-779(-)
MRDTPRRAKTLRSSWSTLTNTSMAHRLWLSRSGSLATTTTVCNSWSRIQPLVCQNPRAKSPCTRKRASKHSMWKTPEWSRARLGLCSAFSTTSAWGYHGLSKLVLILRARSGVTHDDSVKNPICDFRAPPVWIRDCRQSQRTGVSTTSVATPKSVLGIMVSELRSSLRCTPMTMQSCSVGWLRMCLIPARTYTTPGLWMRSERARSAAAFTSS